MQKISLIICAAFLTEDALTLMRNPLSATSGVHLRSSSSRNPVAFFLSIYFDSFFASFLNLALYFEGQGSIISIPLPAAL